MIDLQDKIPYILFKFCEEAPLYIKEIIAINEYGEEIQLDYQIHSGMFQDSVLIEDYDLDIDIRFFPYLGNRCSFYAWEIPEKYEIFIMNISKKEQLIMEFNLPHDTFYIESNEVQNVTEPNYDNRYRRLDGHIGPAIDRNNIWDLSYKKGLKGYFHYDHENEYPEAEQKFHAAEVILKDKITCPVCGGNNFALVTGRKTFKKISCDDCKKTYKLEE